MYFPLIDILRFLAAFGVMCFHYFGSFSGDVLFSTFAQYGFLGVELFFIISGFVIFFSVSKPFKEYVLGRFLRIYPLFWFLCTITYVATFIFPGADHLPFLTYLRNLLVVNDGKIASLVDGVYWTLTIEILFYIYIGAFSFLFGEKKLPYFFIGWIIASIVTFSGGFQDFFITKILIMRYAPYFSFGGLLAYFYKNKGILSAKAKYFFLAIMGVSTLLPLYISDVLKNNPDSTLTNHFAIFDDTGGVIVLSFFVLVFLGVYFSRKINRKSIIRVAKILGGTTYPLYLIHNKLGSLIIGKSYGTVTKISVLTAIGMIAVCIFVSIREEKIRKYLKKKIIAIFFHSRAEQFLVEKKQQGS